MTGREQPGLFPVEALTPLATDPESVCRWHGAGEDRPPVTHRRIRAVNLMDRRWWQNGRRLGCLCCPDRRHPIRLYTVGCDVCTECATAHADGPPRRLRAELVQHFVPIDGMEQP